MNTLAVIYVNDYLESIAADLAAGRASSRPRRSIRRLLADLAGNIRSAASDRAATHGPVLPSAN